MKLRVRSSLVVGVAATVVALACSSSSPTSPPLPAPTPSTTPAATPAPTPSPTTSPGSSACPLGDGTLNSTCSRTAPVLLPAINAAIEKLARERPDVVNTSQTQGPGQYRVLDADALYEGVVANLRAQGLCANYDLAEIQVKDSNAFSEQYDILLSTEHLRRGDGSYRSTCTPAIFPVDPALFIDSLRVAFYGYRCPAGVTAPPNSSGRLPLGCDGYVTASPKDRNNRDVDPRLHGSDITWFVHEGESFVSVDEFPGVAFNKTLTGKQPGRFVLCAVVKGVQGCLNGEVVP